MIDTIILSVLLVLIGLYFWGMIRTIRKVSGPPPWPLRLVTDATGTPRMAFVVVMLGIAVGLMVLLVATTPTRAEQRQQQLDRIEQMLQALLDQHR